MKRWTLRITICLILGMVTTVGVAWGLSYQTTLSRRGAEVLRQIDSASNSPDVMNVTSRSRCDARFFSSGIGWCRTERRDARTVAVLTLQNSSDVRMSEMEWPAWLDDAEAAPEDTIRVREARGWPYLAMYGGFDLQTTNSTIQVKRTVSAVVVESDDKARGLFTMVPSGIRILALRPILPGFLVNTVFYAAIWFGLFFMIERTRRSFRTRRGRCPRCGYDLRSEFADGCPECGWGRAVD